MNANFLKSNPYFIDIQDCNDLNFFTKKIDNFNAFLLLPKRYKKQFENSLIFTIEESLINIDFLLNLFDDAQQIALRNNYQDLLFYFTQWNNCSLSKQQINFYIFILNIFHIIFVFKQQLNNDEFHSFIEYSKHVLKFYFSNYKVYYSVIQTPTTLKSIIIQLSNNINFNFSLFYFFLELFRKNKLNTHYINFKFNMFFIKYLFQNNDIT